MIYLGSDHGGYDLKEKIKGWLTEWDYEYEDLGNREYDEEDDYPVYAFLVAQKVGESEMKRNNYPVPWKKRDKGILLCRSSAGMVIAANKVKGVRAAAVFNDKGVKHCRLHNDANVIALSGDWLDENKAREIIKVWLETEYSSEVRHSRRLKLIADFENGI